MKFSTNFKAVTITTETYYNTNTSEIVKGYVIVDTIFHGELVTLIYQTQSVIVEFNLSNMKVDHLEFLCKMESIATTTEKLCNVPMTKTEILEIIEKEKRDAKWFGSEDQYWAIVKKWRFVSGNIDSLFKNTKWRKEVFTHNGLPFYKTGFKKGKMTKSQLINALLNQSQLVYDNYGFFIA